MGRNRVQSSACHSSRRSRSVSRCILNIMGEWLAPLGATWIEEEQSYQFVLYSRHAQTVTLLLYGDTDAVNPLFRIPLTYPDHKTSRYWHIRVKRAEVPDARYFAWQISGPNDPELGLRYDADKILLDPYAVGVYFP